jgi:hypothetical protein
MKKILLFPVKVTLIVIAIPTAVFFILTVLGGAILAVGGEWISNLEAHKQKHIDGREY